MTHLFMVMVMVVSWNLHWAGRKVHIQENQSPT